jgi:hypothetical protein
MAYGVLEVRTPGVQLPPCLSIKVKHCFFSLYAPDNYTVYRQLACCANIKLFASFFVQEKFFLSISRFIIFIIFPVLNGCRSKPPVRFETD